jgi:hypothetical protein
MEVLEIFNVVKARSVFDAEDRFVDLPLRGMDMQDGVIVRDTPCPRARAKDYQGGRALQKVAKKFNDTVTPKKAIEIFDRLLARKSFDFQHPYGCEARAHLMCAALFDMNLVPAKAWADNGNWGIRFQRPGSDETVKMKYHVAPTLKVRMPDKEIKEVVLDPSLFDGPVFLREWGRAMRLDAAHVTVAEFGVPPEFPYNKWTTDYYDEKATTLATDAAALREMRAIKGQNSPKAKVFESPFRATFARK